MRAKNESHGLLWVAWGVALGYRHTIPAAADGGAAQRAHRAAGTPGAVRGAAAGGVARAAGVAGAGRAGLGGGARYCLGRVRAGVGARSRKRCGRAIPRRRCCCNKTQPVFAALLARGLLGEPLGRRFWGVLAAALGGAYLVSFGLRLPAAGVEGTAGLLALGAAALWGGSTVLGRFVLERQQDFRPSPRCASWPPRRCWRS